MAPVLQRRAGRQGLADPRIHVPRRVGPALEAQTLTGRWVALEPLIEAHREPLRDAANDERIWATTIVRAVGEGFDPWFDTALAERAAGHRLPFAVCRLSESQYVGCTCYLDITPKHRRLEIGGTWYHPDSWATMVNPECKLLLMTHAFEVLGVQRVAFVTDVLNERSQAAISKLGATREGVLRSHMVAQGGRMRDSVVFSIVAAEWPHVKEELERRLGRR
jgi:RimJ/RimL family protein N-acetyltransferase